MNKKIISLILCILFTASTLFGCSFVPKALKGEQLDNDDSDDTLAASADDTSELPQTDASELPLSEPETTEPHNKTEEVNVRPAEWSAVEWEDYSSQYFTLKIPKGWKVQCRGDASQMQWMVTSPDENVGLSNLDHAYAAKDAGIGQSIGMDISLSLGTVQEYFEAVFANSTDYFTVKNSCVPSNKEQLQAIRPNTPIHDYQTLYAVFKENGLEGEGIYSAVIMDSPDVITGGRNYGVWEINIVFTEWAPQGQLVNWIPVLSNIAQSFAYTDYYLQQWKSIASGNTSSPSTMSDTDPVMEAFEERSKSDIIIQEKRSDMLGEYERVYDNNTGEIYRAYNGFLDDIGSEQKRYTSITDNQYAEGFVGWIDKP